MGLHNRFYRDMCNINKNITMEVQLISPPTYNVSQMKFDVTYCVIEKKRLSSLCSLLCSSHVAVCLCAKL